MEPQPLLAPSGAGSVPSFFSREGRTVLGGSEPGMLSRPGLITGINCRWAARGVHEARGAGVCFPTVLQPAPSRGSAGAAALNSREKGLVCVLSGGLVIFSVCWFVFLSLI